VYRAYSMCLNVPKLLRLRVVDGGAFVSALRTVNVREDSQ